MKPTQKTAAATYSDKVKTINTLLARIEEAVAADFFKAEREKHWGDVGDLAYIEEQLQRITDQIYKEGEFAPENAAKAGA